METLSIALSIAEEIRGTWWRNLTYDNRKGDDTASFEEIGSENFSTLTKEFQNVVQPHPPKNKYKHYSILKLKIKTVKS